MPRFIRNMCKIEFLDGPYVDDHSTISPGRASSNGDDWIICRVGEDGKAHRVDQLSQCQVVGDEGDESLLVTGLSTLLVETGVPEEDAQVRLKITQNPQFA